MRLGYLEGPFEHGSRSVKIVNSVLGVPKKDAPDKPRMCVNLTGSKVNEKLEFIKFLYGWMPHNASFGFLDLAPSILHSNWF